MTMAKELTDKELNHSLSKMQLGSSIQDAIAEGKIKVEHRGHYGNGRFDIKRCVKDALLIPECSPYVVRKLNQELKSPGSLRRFITITDSSCLRSCPICDQDLAFEMNGKILRPTTECKYPDGMVIEFELNVPSGKIVAKDDLREWFNYYGDFNINSSIGVMQTTLEMEKIGCAYGFVGNSCPGIYRQEDDTYIIAIGAYVDEDHSDIEPLGKHVAGICTDLWWYSLVDYDEFRRRAGDVKPDEIGAEIFDVKPGVYHFHHFERDLNHPETNKEPYTYAEFRWARKPDPVQ